MKRVAAALLAALALGSCARSDHKTHLYLQRFFGECGAEYGGSTDVAKAEGECGIITTLVNRFNAENPDIQVDVNVVAWPGYPQLTAQVAARDPPDLVTMHEGVISDYASKGLVEPVDDYLRAAGISPDRLHRSGAAGRHHVRPHLRAAVGHARRPLPRQHRAVRQGRADARRQAGAAEHARTNCSQQARQFEQRTGKPYLIQSNVGDPAFAARNLYTYMMAQGAVLFPDPKHIRLNTPIGVSVANYFRRINAEQLGTQNMDTPAAIAAFVSGEGGIYPTGTWMIGSFEQEANTPGRPLYKSYAVFPYPRLWGEHVEYVSGHSWVVPARKRTPQQREAIARFFKFMAAHNYDWARTGHIPAFKAVLDDPRFKALPHRADIAPLASIGRPLPSYVLRQNAIEGIVGEEAAAAFTGQKSVPQALAEAERRVDELLAQVD